MVFVFLVLSVFGFFFFGQEILRFLNQTYVFFSFTLFAIVSTGSSSCSNKFFALCENLIALILFFSNALIVLYLIKQRLIMLNKTLFSPSLSLSSNFFGKKFLFLYLNFWYCEKLFAFCKNKLLEALSFLDLLMLIPLIKISLLCPMTKLVVINSICWMFSPFIFISPIINFLTSHIAYQTLKNSS